MRRLASSYTMLLVTMCMLVIFSFGQDVKDLAAKPVSESKPANKKEFGEFGMGKPGIDPKDNEGYPKQRRLKGHEGKALYQSGPTSIGGGKAEAKIYPGGGRMSAEDVRHSMAPVSRLTYMAKVADKSDRAIAVEKRKIFDEMVKQVLATASQPIVGQDMLRGKLSQQLGMQKGNLAICKSALLRCTASKSSVLGQSRGLGKNTLKQSKHTAVQEDVIRRNDDPAAKEKALNKANPTRNPGKSAVQEYIHKQSRPPYTMFPNEPGLKTKKDRLKPTEARDLVYQIDSTIGKAEKMDELEDKILMDKVKKASAKQMQTLRDVNKATLNERAAGAVRPKVQVVQELATVSQALFNCRKSLVAQCPTQPLKVGKSVIPVESKPIQGKAIP